MENGVHTMPLTDKEIKALQPSDKPRKYADGQRMCIEVRPTGTKAFLQEYTFLGKNSRITIGKYPEVSLKEARIKAAEIRAKVASGIDPLKERKLAKQGLLRRNENTFAAVAWEWFAKKESETKASHSSKIKGRLNGYILPEIGEYPIAEVTAPILLDALRKLENKGLLETAKRVRGLTGEIFRYAIATGRADRNPAADLVGALKAPKAKHMAALTEPKDAGLLMLAIEGYSGTLIGETALELSPYLFLRPGELRQMEWSEVDFETHQVTIPAERMKMGADHIVPLSKQAEELLTRIYSLTGRGRYVFPSQRSAQRPMSDNAVRTALRSIGYANDQMTPHGFRAMARTLLDEQLKYRPDWIEHQLAHTVKDPNGRAYNRTVFLEERAEMMQAYADYLDALREQARTGPPK